MSTAQIRLATLWRREVNRFMKIKKQTLGAPLLETFLYITVFGAALGSRIKELHAWSLRTHTTSASMWERESSLRPTRAR